MSMRMLWALTLALTGTPALAQVAQERVDLAVNARIREEGFDRSQIETLAGHLTDVIGPRLTGSSGMMAANRWTAETFRKWGLENVVIEPWGDFGRGWERVSYAGRILTPFVQPLDAMPVAWTGSTRGTITAQVVRVDINERADIEKYRGKLKGMIVIRDTTPRPAPEFTAALRRLDADTIIARLDSMEAARPRERRAGFRERAALSQAIDSLYLLEGVAAVLTPSPWQYSVLRVGGARAARGIDAPILPPALVVSIEQYGQIYRNLERNIPVRIELNVQNRFLTSDAKAYNTLADLPGTDKADEFVMIGAHLDSWHAGTGATDNGAGSVVMMEAMRILKALDLKPRRTIRIALWSGEEQGLLGSRAWLANHKDLWPKISAYLNVDNGTGRLRGIWDQGNERAIPVFEQILWPFRDLGVVAVRHGTTGSTDHIAFAEQSVPGFNFIQDPIEYSLRTHHSNVDTFDHLVLEDLRQAAVIVAATAYALAMRDEMMPRAATPASSSN